MANAAVSGENVYIESTLIDQVPDSGEVSIKSGDANSSGYSGPILLDVGAADNDDQRGDIRFSSSYIHMKNSPQDSYGMSKLIRKKITSGSGEEELAKVFTDENVLYEIKAIVIAKKSDLSCNVYELAARFENDSGVVNRLGSQDKEVKQEDDVNLDCNLEVDGTDIKVIVEGASGVKWVAFVDKYSNGL